MIKALKNRKAEQEGQRRYAGQDKNIPQIKRRLHKVDVIKGQGPFLVDPAARKPILRIATIGFCLAEVPLVPDPRDYTYRRRADIKRRPILRAICRSDKTRTTPMYKMTFDQQNQLLRLVA